eukprot:COSAG03_NODE_10874_length_624_cov_1.028571_2_plen_68_part_00
MECCVSVVATFEQERRRLAKQAEDAALLRMKKEEIEEKVAASNERLALRKMSKVNGSLLSRHRLHWL